MPARPLLVVALLAALIGCKKRSGGSDRSLEEAFGLSPGAPGAPGVAEPFLPPPPLKYPDTAGGKLAEAFDRGAATLPTATRGSPALNEWSRPLAAVLKMLPETTPGQAAHETTVADRELIDVAFARLWREYAKVPEFAREENIHWHGTETVLRKLGTYEDGRRLGESVVDRVVRVDVREDGDAKMTPGGFASAVYVNVNVPHGARAKWSGPGMWATGSVNLREQLSIHASDRVGLQLRGSVGELALNYREGFWGWSCADLVALKVPKVTVGGGSRCVLRVGPETRTVQYNGLGNFGLLLIRGTQPVRVTAGPADPTAEPGFGQRPVVASVVVIRY